MVGNSTMTIRLPSSQSPSGTSGTAARATLPATVSCDGCFRQGHIALGRLRIDDAYFRYDECTHCDKVPSGATTATYLYLCCGPCSFLYSDLSIRSRKNALSMSLMPVFATAGIPASL